MTMESTMRRNFINLKIGAVLFLILIFYIGLFFISNLVDERQSYQQQVIQDIAKEQIRPQQVIAPYLKSLIKFKPYVPMSKRKLTLVSKHYLSP